jgi:CheY-like chemotaxis protein
MNTKKILLLEDDPDDRFITESVLSELDHKPEIIFVTTSDELFSLLGQDQLPGLILVDFNSKPENGLKVLQRLKENEKLKAIPVVILGDSSDASYIRDCYNNGASSVIKKPDLYEATRNKITQFFNYWMKVAEL